MPDGESWLSVTLSAERWADLKAKFDEEALEYWVLKAGAPPVREAVVVVGDQSVTVVARSGTLAYDLAASSPLP
jgi:hypothetical protein